MKFAPKVVAASLFAPLWGAHCIHRLTVGVNMVPGPMADFIKRGASTMKTQNILTATLLVAAGLLSACATTGVVTAPVVADNLRAPADQVPALEVSATGVQIYVCSAAKAEANRLEWAFKAPEAELFDASGTKVGKHYAGPTWEGNDGSKVVGEVKARDDGPDANAIPWLLLKAKSNAGNGVFAKTLSIQRVRTVGGKAPAGVCAQLGSEARVPYTAAYYFYDARPY